MGVEADIKQLYENWFIETCEDWVVPFIGDLIGYRLVHEAGPPGDPSTPAGRERNRILIPRREVANTVRYRRRKGTLALLELLARDVANWPARAVEFCDLLSVTQSVRLAEYEYAGWRTKDLNAGANVLPLGKTTIDLRQGDVLDRIDGPFDEFSHTPDFRQLRGKLGRYNIPKLNFHLFRLLPFKVVFATPDERGDGRYTLDPSGRDIPLFRPDQRPDPRQWRPPREVELPSPIPCRGRQSLFEIPDVLLAPNRTFENDQ